MTKLPSRRQADHNPLIARDSQYRCIVPDCAAHGVWSPMLNGPTWYCREHAGLPQPKHSVCLSVSESAVLMRSIFGRVSNRTDDPEFDAERDAIEGEGT